jgi:NADH:ubiquinone oxidoreductase subunit 6 (subunit J)
MIAFAPIEEEEIPYAPITKVPKRIEKVTKVTKVTKEIDENTECNYLVMFFIAGVVLLAAMDSVQPMK